MCWADSPAHTFPDAVEAFLGVVVNLMRKAGRGEIAVALVVYTFFFGIIMYLALRLTGSLIWPILLHASTDPTLFLFGGDH